MEHTMATGKFYTECLKSILIVEYCFSEDIYHYNYLACLYIVEQRAGGCSQWWQGPEYRESVATRSDWLWQCSGHCG